MHNHQTVGQQCIEQMLIYEKNLLKNQSSIINSSWENQIITYTFLTDGRTDISLSIKKGTVSTFVLTCAFDDGLLRDESRSEFTLSNAYYLVSMAFKRMQKKVLFAKNCSNALSPFLYKNVFQVYLLNVLVELVVLILMLQLLYDQNMSSYLPDGPTVDVFYYNSIFVVDIFQEY